MVFVSKNVNNQINSSLPKNKSSINAIYISSYIPRKCGIATFTNDLVSAINRLNIGNPAEMIAMTDNGQSYEYTADVKREIKQLVKSDYEKAADYINKSAANIVNLQHEFGLYRVSEGNATCCLSAGAKGPDDSNAIIDEGTYLLDMLRKVTKPIVTTFHTILSNPDNRQIYEMSKLIELSSAVIAMTETSKKTLIRVYGCPLEKVKVICHGVPDFLYNESKKYQKKLGIIKADPMILAAGLLGPGKGLEYTINAMPSIVKAAPNAKLFIVGQTHPVIIKNEGEVYREKLIQLIAKNKVTDNVVFVNRYLAGGDLFDYFQAADFFVTPYSNMQQSASGTLAWALGAGKICVSTPYQYAREMLADGAGILVRQKSSVAISRSIINAFNDPKLKESIHKKAYSRGHKSIWSNVAAQYAELFGQCIEQNSIK